METTIKAEYIQKTLCQKCLLSDHDELHIRKPYRKVVQDVKGLVICAKCGSKARNGYTVIYECTGEKYGRK
jgi:hypothetical protein